MKNSKPEIAFFGSGLVTACRDDASTCYRGIIKYLDRLGYRVVVYQHDASGLRRSRLLPGLESIEVVGYQENIDSVQSVLRKASNADIIVKAGGDGALDELIEKSFPEIRKPNQKIIFWDMDAPATLDYAGRKDESFRKLIPQYDYIFTSGGGDRVVSAYKALGARECIPVYNALDPETNFSVNRDARFEADLSFFGERLPGREAKVKEYLMDVAEKMPGKKFIIGGSGWDDLQFSPNVRYVNHVFRKDHNAFNSSAHFVLNIGRGSMSGYGFSPSCRVFEAAGAGACIITDQREGIEEFFVPGKEILVAGNGREAELFISDIGPEEAAEIGKAAKRRVLADHTYEKRAMLLSKIFSEQEVLY